ncbi:MULTISPECIES: cell division protein FtsL [unclassified Uliginosibacterium]|uniref:cell division protein FtsL n=1 Tax=unclassified Uliginosibacterium TaxID=2621521 RepID=UPI000C7DE953|nr:MULTISPECIES: cell division protein FtsL [unclassified Uliginosibacterium]MDO6387372.1 cell division protein FtsL [Uliginosibacterium sp. 31-12]PLK47171.1 cell division protein FtsL [Uliginosibacterium sp. TH139]
MIRFTAFLMIAVVASSLGVVASQHSSRKLVTAIEREQVRTRNLEVEWTQLDIEQQAVAALPTVERFARSTLRMQAPVRDAEITLDPAGGGRG